MSNAEINGIQRKSVFQMMHCNDNDINNSDISDIKNNASSDAATAAVPIQYTPYQFTDLNFLYLIFSSRYFCSADVMETANTQTCQCIECNLNRMRAMCLCSVHWLYVWLVKSTKNKNKTTTKKTKIVLDSWRNFTRREYIDLSCAFLPHGNGKQSDRHRQIL